MRNAISCPFCGASLRTLSISSAGLHVARCKARPPAGSLKHASRAQNVIHNGGVLVAESMRSPDWIHVERFVLPHFHRREIAAAARILGAPVASEREGRPALIRRFRGRWRYVRGADADPGW